MYLKNNWKKTNFLLVSWRSLTERAGSGSGSASQRYRTADPDSDKNVTEQLSYTVPGTILIGL
jgi:hypothetical protein